MHWSFFIFTLCAVAGWSTGYIVRAVSAPPSWLVE